MSTKKQAVRPSRTETTASQPAPKAHTRRAKAPTAAVQPVQAPNPTKAKVTRAARTLAMLKRKSGVSLDEMVAEFGVQRHSAPALVSVVSRRAGVKAALAGGRYTVL